jgi:hypothetical protein
MPRARSGPQQRPRTVDGNHVLYRYLQGELLRSDVWLFQMLAARLVSGLGIWLAPDIYSRYPLLRPYAVRDPESRGNARRGIPDQWGSPDTSGLFRDDNSLVKRMPFSLQIEAPRNSIYDGARVSQGYVASHVWRQLSGSAVLASRNKLTYSFVPNLVWLPREVSKLTDREGSFVQGFIQALAISIYRDVPVQSQMRPIVEEAWELLPAPIGIPPEGLPSPDELNYFIPTDAIYSRWLADLEKVIEALRLARERRPIRQKVIATRYGAGLSGVSRQALSRLEGRLNRYERAVRASLAEDHQ